MKHVNFAFCSRAQCTFMGYQNSEPPHEKVLAGMCIVNFPILIYSNDPIPHQCPFYLEAVLSQDALPHTVPNASLRSPPENRAQEGSTPSKMRTI